MKRIEDRIKRSQRLKDSGYLMDNQGRLIHRVVCKEAHGDFPNSWVVHHVDENKANNTPDNLIAMPRAIYNRIHACVRGQRVLFTRKNIEQIITSYVNLSKNKDLKVQINITISYDQIKNTDELPVLSNLVSRSGSASYR